MKTIFSLLLTFFLVANSYGQIFSYGSSDVAFRKMIANGVTFIKTGNEVFDSTMIECLEKYWTISEFDFVERYKKPGKEGTALFVTTKEPTKKYFSDRKNQHVLVIQNAEFYHKDKTVPMEQTLGYMYYNGFYGLLEEEDEYLFNRYIIQSLNRGLTIIKEKDFSGSGELNEKIAEVILQESQNPLGNTLIINRELITHCIDMKVMNDNDVTNRLFAKEEFYESLNTQFDTHYLLYYAVNTKTELSLINVKTGNLIYTKSFPEGYISLKAKEVKLFATFF